MKRTAQCIRRFAVAAALLSLSAAELSASPVVVLDPPRPVAGDSLTLRLLLGTAGPGCASQFTNVTSSITDGRPVANRPCRQITVRYTTVPPNSDSACTGEPAWYGPEWSLGELDSCYYLILVGGAWDTLALFDARPPSGTGLRLSGTVRELSVSHAPLCGVPVRLQTPDVVYASLPKGQTEPPLETIGYVRTDTAGQYAFPSLTEGIYKVKAACVDHDADSLTFELRADRLLDLELRPQGRYGAVVGTVNALTCTTTVDGAACDSVLVPLEGCPVFLRGPSAGAFDNGEVITDSLGRFRFDRVQADTAQLTVTVYGGVHGSESRTFRLIPDSTVSVDFVLRQLFQHKARQSIGSLEMVLRTSRREYLRGQPIEAIVALVNRTESDTVLHFDSLYSPPGSGSLMLEVSSQLPDGFMLKSDRYVGCYPISSEVILAAADSFVTPTIQLQPMCVITLPITPKPASHEAEYLPKSSTMTEQEIPDSIELVAWLREYRDISETKLWVYYVDSFPLAAHPIQRPAPDPGNHCTVSGARLIITLDHAQRVTVVLFSLDGRVVAAPVTAMRLGAGRHVIDLSRPAAAGRLLIARIVGENFRAVHVLGARGVLEMAE